MQTTGLGYTCVDIDKLESNQDPRFRTDETGRNLLKTRGKCQPRTQGLISAPRHAPTNLTYSLFFQLRSTVAICGRIFKVTRVLRLAKKVTRHQQDAAVLWYGNATVYCYGSATSLPRMTSVPLRYQYDRSRRTSNK